MMLICLVNAAETTYVKPTYLRYNLIESIAALVTDLLAQVPPIGTLKSTNRGQVSINYLHTRYLMIDPSIEGTTLTYPYSCIPT